MDKATMIYYCNLMAVAGRVINEKQVYNEPWDQTDKDYLLDSLGSLREAMAAHSSSDLTNAGAALASQLTQIINSEYNIRIHCIAYDLDYLNRHISCIEFPNLSVMVERAESLKREFPSNQPVDFLMRFDTVHRYYYYGEMVCDFIKAVSSYAEFALAMGQQDNADALIALLGRCNREGSPYIDSNNLYFIAPEADSLAETIMRTF